MQQENRLCVFPLEIPSLYALTVLFSNDTRKVQNMLYCHKTVYLSQLHYTLRRDKSFVYEDFGNGELELKITKSCRFNQKP
jgi:hypothetical protein